MSCVLGQTYHLLVCLRSYVHEIIVHRILRLVLETHFIMKMRASGFSRRADFPYLLATAYHLAFLDKNFGEMAVPGQVVVSMIHINAIAVATFPICNGDAAVGGGIDPSPFWSRKVKSCMKGSRAIHRIPPIAVAGSHRVCFHVDWQYRRYVVQFVLLFGSHGFQFIERYGLRIKAAVEKIKAASEVRNQFGIRKPLQFPITGLVVKTCQPLPRLSGSICIITL